MATYIFIIVYWLLFPMPESSKFWTWHKYQSLSTRAQDYLQTNNCINSNFTFIVIVMNVLSLSIKYKNYALQKTISFYLILFKQHFLNHFVEVHVRTTTWSSVLLCLLLQFNGLLPHLLSFISVY